MDLIKYNNKYEILPFGFHNIGNTCYFNALLQALLSCTSFNQLIIENKDKYKKNKILLIFIELFERLEDKDINTYSGRIWKEMIEYIKKNNIYKKFSKGQEDACEGFYLLMQIINPENKYSQYKFHEFDKLFRHRYVSLIHCSNCNTCVSKKNDEYIIFEIEPHIILDNLQHKKYNSQNIINEYLLKQLSYTDNDYICPKCKKKDKKQKLTNLIMVPEILIILVKNYNIRNQSKYNIIMPYPKQIYFDCKINNNKLLYEPIAQIEHSGNMNSGHYWAICKRKNGWYLFNDNNYRSSNFKPTVNTYMVFYHYIKNT